MKRWLWLMPATAILLLWPARLMEVHAQGKVHSDVLTWNASTSTNVAKYNIYRSTTTAAGYVNIGNVPAATLTFSDSTGTGGTKYFYVVTALDSGGDESIFSNEASVIFLVNPNPPTGLVVVAN